MTHCARAAGPVRPGDLMSLNPELHAMLKYATLLAGLLLVAPAFGQGNQGNQANQDPAADYPKRPIRVIVCVPAGGGVDTVTRIVADKLGQKLGQPVVVENRTGQSG